MGVGLPRPGRRSPLARTANRARESERDPASGRVRAQSARRRSHAARILGRRRPTRRRPPIRSDRAESTIGWQVSSEPLDERDSCRTTRGAESGGSQARRYLADLAPPATPPATGEDHWFARQRLQSNDDAWGLENYPTTIQAMKDRSGRGATRSADGGLIDDMAPTCGTIGYRYTGARLPGELSAARREASPRREWIAARPGDGECSTVGPHRSTSRTARKPLADLRLVPRRLRKVGGLGAT